MLQITTIKEKRQQKNGETTKPFISEEEIRLQRKLKIEENLRIKAELKRGWTIFELLSEDYQKCDKIVFKYIQELEKISVNFNQGLQSLGINEESYFLMIQKIIDNALELQCRSDAKLPLSIPEKVFLKEALDSGFLLPKAKIPNLNSRRPLLFPKPEEDVPLTSFASLFYAFG